MLEVIGLVRARFAVASLFLLLALVFLFLSQPVFAAGQCAPCGSGGVRAASCGPCGTSSAGGLAPRTSASSFPQAPAQQGFDTAPGDALKKISELLKKFAEGPTPFDKGGTGVLVIKDASTKLPSVGFSAAPVPQKISLAELRKEVSKYFDNVAAEPDDDEPPFVQLHADAKKPDSDSMKAGDPTSTGEQKLPQGASAEGAVRQEINFPDKNPLNDQPLLAAEERKQKIDELLKNGAEPKITIRACYGCKDIRPFTLGLEDALLQKGIVFNRLEQTGAFPQVYVGGIENANPISQPNFEGESYIFSGSPGQQRIAGYSNPGPDLTGKPVPLNVDQATAYFRENSEIFSAYYNDVVSRVVKYLGN